jgi:multidrug resistance efflux pump
MRERTAALLAPGRLGRKVAAGAAALGLLWFLFGTMHYEVTVPCTVRPTQMRHVAAPFEGVLASADRLAGDIVRAGDVLCTFDPRELELQRADLAAQLAVLEREKDSAMAQNNPAQVQVVLANQELARVRLGIVERRLAQARLAAPLDGLIVRGDLRTRVGAVLALGDPLYEVAPLDRWTLELEVPEHVAADLAGGLPGSFALHARPERSRAFRISHVVPSAEVRDTRNVFIAEADLEQAQPWMRPGMEGAARVDFGRRRVWWVALHRVLDYMHLNLWL